MTSPVLIPAKAGIHRGRFRIAAGSFPLTPAFAGVTGFVQGPR
jgi:hypothetical protein